MDGFEMEGTIEVRRVSSRWKEFSTLLMNFVSFWYTMLVSKSQFILYCDVWCRMYDVMLLCCVLYIVYCDKIWCVDIHFELYCGNEW